jgi:hypothetical protein
LPLLCIQPLYYPPSYAFVLKVAHVKISKAYFPPCDFKQICNT